MKNGTGSHFSRARQLKNKNRYHFSKRGFTFIELIITIVISAIAMMALSAPFVAERRFWLLGTARSESQRDAQIVLRSMARAVRASNLYAGNGVFNVTCPGGSASTRQFLRGGNQLQFVDNCPGGQTITWIDGNRSQVTNFTITALTSRLVQVRLDVTYNSGTSNQSESLITEILLRNAT